MKMDRTRSESKSECKSDSSDCQTEDGAIARYLAP